MRSVNPPHRGDIRSRWEAVIGREVSREAVHDWSEPLYLSWQGGDPIVLMGLTYLHGLDMTYRSADRRLTGHGPPGEYVLTQDDVAARFEYWLQECRSHDRDPERWKSERRRVTEQQVRADRAREQP